MDDVKLHLGVSEMLKNTERLTVKVSKEKRAEYEELAEKMGITMSGLIKIAVALFIKNNK